MRPAVRMLLAALVALTAACSAGQVPELTSPTTSAPSGTVAAATTLVASSTPRDQSGYALGLLQTAVWTGASVGPLMGGVVADTWGYRAAFWVTGSLLFVAGLIVWRFVKEDFRPPDRDKDEPDSGFWDGIKLVVHNRSLLSLFGIRVIVRSSTRQVACAVWTQIAPPLAARPVTEGTRREPEARRRPG